MVVMLRIAHCLSVDGNSARKSVFHPEKQLGGGAFIGDFIAWLAYPIMPAGLSLCHSN